MQTPEFHVMAITGGKEIVFPAPQVAAFVARRRLMADEQYKELLKSEDKRDEILAGMLANVAHCIECARVQKVSGVSKPSEITFDTCYDFSNRYWVEIVYPSTEEDEGQADENPTGMKLVRS
jgi:hypothetical protein